MTHHVLKKIEETCGGSRKEGSARPKSVRTEENIKLVKGIIFGHENQRGTHSTPAEIVRELNIDRQSVSCVINQELDLRLLRKRKVQKLANLNTEK